MIDAVRRYDGYVVQSTGDGIFALFGAPVARKIIRNALCIPRCGCKMKSGAIAPVCEQKAATRSRSGRRNSGEVVVRTIETGAMHTEYTPIGHTVNLASRLQSLANAGSTVISDSTRKLVEGIPR